MKFALDAPCGQCAAILVSHNGGQFIKIQLASILNQSHPIDLLIVVDDNSTDETPNLVAEFAAATELRVVFIRSENHTPGLDLKSRISENFSRALREIGNQNYIFLSDQDDVWLPHRVAHQRELLESTEYELISSDGALIDEFNTRLPGTIRDHFPIGTEVWEDRPRISQLMLTIRFPSVTGATVALKSTFLDYAIPIPPGMLHDRWFAICSAARGTLFQDDNAVIQYRIHSRQTVGLSNPSVRERFSTVLKSRQLTRRFFRILESLSRAFRYRND
jgi:glycosyltransferase involved in cell wall biosynthesis